VRLKNGIMKANTQYNDFIGTSAADISDHAYLSNYLEKQGVDIEEYKPIGFSFYTSYNNFFSYSIICNWKNEIVSLSFEEELTKDDFFNLFKRFNVICLRKHCDFHNKEITKEVTIDNRNEKNTN
jgi:hypothetical protein